MRLLGSLAEVAGDYDAIVLDQWGVLHDGSTPYFGAVDALRGLRAGGARLAVLSNSGKRGAVNADRIAAMGYPASLFDLVMTSGEALWTDLAEGRLTARRLLPVEAAPGDAARWLGGMPGVTMVDDPEAAEAVLLMGLADDADPAPVRAILARTRMLGLPHLCSNPDRASPRAGGRTVVSPGELAHELEAAGGEVCWYGKPHLPVFEAVSRALGGARLLMVGDSPEHDVAGAKAAGWDAVLVAAGLHAAAFHGADPLEAAAKVSGAFRPDFVMERLA